MGTCISKCKPKKRSRQDSISSHVHDKLVISQEPALSSLPSMEATEKKTLSPSISSCSAASLSSFSCSANSKFTLDSSISSASSCASSVLVAKDRSFSNEFLVSCVKENQHVVGLKEKNMIGRIHPQKSEFSSTPLMKQSIVQERPIITVSAPKKRSRSRSPSLVRQKSLRKDQSFTCPTPNRGLRSPSPSRRVENNRSFVTNGMSNDSFSRRQSVSRGSSVNSVSYGARRESFRASASPKRDVRVNRNVSLSKNGTFRQEVGAKIGNVADGDVQMSQEMDVLMEDLNNPLIAMDCFIFL